MNRWGPYLLSFLFLVVWGCGADSAPEIGEEVVSDAPAAPRLDPDDPSILQRPFTADQIQEEWVEGFTLRMLRVTPEGESLERWTVVSATEEGAEIEFAEIDEAGEVVGVPTMAESSWAQLRDHATFPAASSNVEEATRETALGWLDGRLYTVRDDEAGTVTEYFFVDELPGAPVEMRTTRDGELVVGLRQVERRRPGR
jgi:hypothetical protein